MVVQQAKAVQHVVGLEGVHHVHDLGRGHAEGGALSSGIRPVSARLDRQFGPHAKVGPHAQSLGALQQHVQLAGHFQHEKDVEAQTQGLKP